MDLLVDADATVQVQCGSSVIASTTTNSNGAFAMLLSEQTSTVSDLLSRCKLVIPTPVSTCDASLRATGNLQSPLQLLSGNGLDGLLGNKSLLGDIFGKGGLLGGILGGDGLLGGILGPSKYTVAGNWERRQRYMIRHTNLKYVHRHAYVSSDSTTNDMFP